MAFFITLVVSYIFKDRIKEIVRDYLSSKLLRFFYDQKVRICTCSRKHQIGSSRESFSFVGDDKLDDEIMTLRNRDPISRIGEYTAGEKIHSLPQEDQRIPGTLRTGLPCPAGQGDHRYHALQRCQNDTQDGQPQTASVHYRREGLSKDQRKEGSPHQLHYQVHST
jgi:hypothetical protein